MLAWDRGAAGYDKLFESKRAGVLEPKRSHRVRAPLREETFGLVGVLLFFPVSSLGDLGSFPIPCVDPREARVDHGRDKARSSDKPTQRGAVGLAFFFALLYVEYSYEKLLRPASTGTSGEVLCLSKMDRGLGFPFCYCVKDGNKLKAIRACAHHTKSTPTLAHIHLAPQCRISMGSIWIGVPSIRKRQ